MVQNMMKQLIYFAEHLCPALSPAEQSVTLQIFSRTAAVGRETCQISHKDITKFTGMSDITVRKAVRSLLGKGILEMAVASKPKTPATYKLHITIDLPQTFKEQRNSY